MLDLDELERLARKATEGPWAVADDDNDGPRQVVSYAYGEELVCETFTGRSENAAFIAAARTAVPELVAEVRRLREGVERIACKGDGQFMVLATYPFVLSEEECRIASKILNGMQKIADNLLAGKRWDGKE